MRWRAAGHASLALSLRCSAASQRRQCHAVDGVGASASYIAVPAVVRVAIPEANLRSTSACRWG